MHTFLFWGTFAVKTQRLSTGDIFCFQFFFFHIILFYKSFKKHIFNATTSTLKQVKNVPSKGTLCSHVGNTPFPVRERFIPTLGI